MSNPIQDLLNMKGDLLAYHTFVSGEFTKEIARLEALDKQLKEKLGKVKTIVDAEKLAEKIVAEANACQAEVDKATRELLERQTALRQQAVEVEQKANEARTLQLQVQDEWHKLQSAKEAFDASRVVVERAQQQKQRDLDSSAQALLKQKEALEAKAANITAALREA